MTTKVPFINTENYWNTRYEKNGNSGKGSYGKSAQFKADTINSFVQENNIKSVIEFGCGDGNQLKYSNYQNYLGIDISEKAVNICKKLFSNDNSKTFITLEDYKNQTAELILSLDVIYHLIEDETYYNYIDNIKNSCDKFLIIFSSNKNESTNVHHVKHRTFTDDLSDSFKLINYIPNPFFNKRKPDTNFANFYFFEKINL